MPPTKSHVALALALSLSFAVASSCARAEGASPASPSSWDQPYTDCMSGWIVTRMNQPIWRDLSAEQLVASADRQCRARLAAPGTPDGKGGLLDTARIERVHQNLLVFLANSVPDWRRRGSTPPPPPERPVAVGTPPVAPQAAVPVPVAAPASASASAPNSASR